MVAQQNLIAIRTHVLAAICTLVFTTHAELWRCDTATTSSEEGGQALGACLDASLESWYEAHSSPVSRSFFKFKATVWSSDGTTYVGDTDAANYAIELQERHISNVFPVPRIHIYYQPPSPEELNNEDEFEAKRERYHLSWVRLRGVVSCDFGDIPTEPLPFSLASLADNNYDAIEFNCAEVFLVGNKADDQSFVTLPTIKDLVFPTIKQSEMGGRKTKRWASVLFSNRRTDVQNSNPFENVHMPFLRKLVVKSGAIPFSWRLKASLQPQLHIVSENLAPAADAVIKRHINTFRVERVAEKSDDSYAQIRLAKDAIDRVSYCNIGEGDLRKHVSRLPESTTHLHIVCCELVNATDFEAKTQSYNPLDEREKWRESIMTTGCPPRVEENPVFRVATKAVASLLELGNDEEDRLRKVQWCLSENAFFNRAAGTCYTMSNFLDFKRAYEAHEAESVLDKPQVETSSEQIADALSPTNDQIKQAWEVFSSGGTLSVDQRGWMYESILDGAGSEMEALLRDKKDVFELADFTRVKGYWHAHENIGVVSGKVKTDAPNVDTPNVDTPNVDTPNVDTPNVDTPNVDAPRRSVDSPNPPNADTLPTQSRSWSYTFGAANPKIHVQDSTSKILAGSNSKIMYYQLYRLFGMSNDRGPDFDAVTEFRKAFVALFLHPCGDHEFPSISSEDIVLLASSDETIYDFEKNIFGVMFKEPIQSWCAPSVLLEVTDAPGDNDTDAGTWYEPSQADNGVWFKLTRADFFIQEDKVAGVLLDNLVNYRINMVPFLFQKLDREVKRLLGSSELETFLMLYNTLSGSDLLDELTGQQYPPENVFALLRHMEAQGLRFPEDGNAPGTTEPISPWCVYQDILAKVPLLANIGDTAGTFTDKSKYEGQEFQYYNTDHDLFSLILEHMGANLVGQARDKLFLDILDPGVEEERNLAEEAMIYPVNETRLFVQEETDSAFSEFEFVRLLKKGFAPESCRARLTNEFYEGTYPTLLATGGLIIAPRTIPSMYASLADTDPKEGPLVRSFWPDQINNWLPGVGRQSNCTLDGGTISENTCTEGRLGNFWGGSTIVYNVKTLNTEAASEQTKELAPASDSDSASAPALASAPASEPAEAPAPAPDSEVALDPDLVPKRRSTSDEASLNMKSSTLVETAATMRIADGVVFKSQLYRDILVSLLSTLNEDAV